MPNVVTIPFFLLDSPLKKQDLSLHCFGAGLKIRFSLPHLLKRPETVKRDHQTILMFCNQATKLAIPHSFMARKANKRTKMVLEWL